MKEQAPHLILLDMELPNTDSFEILRVMRDLSATWIVMLTGRNQAAENARFLEEGADVIVTKPFNSAMLIARIQTVLRRARIYDTSLLPFAMGHIRADEPAAHAAVPQRV